MRAILLLAALLCSACGPGLRDGCIEVADGYRICRYSSCHIVLEERGRRDWISITDRDFVIASFWVIDNKIKLLGGRASTGEECLSLLKNKHYEEFMFIEMNR